MIRVDGLKGQVAVVTGASGGIGTHVVAVLRDNGADCVGLDLKAPAIEGVTGMACDVTDEASVIDVLERVERELGPPAIAVLGAGVYPMIPFEDMTLEVWKHTLDVNLTSAFLVARRVLPGMRAARYGRLVALGSSAGKTGGARSVAAYAAAKAGVMALAKSIASEYAAFGVTSNAVAPAMIDTPMIDAQRELVSRVPVGRLGRPEEVADLVAYLCSSSAAYITGEVIDINGGFLID